MPSRFLQQYGFAFPEDLLVVWNLARRLQPLEPLRAFEESLGLHLVGPFDVLAGRFDRHTPRYPIAQHWRAAWDPPELFTLLVGESGLHWGYWMDHPGVSQPCVVALYPDQDFAPMRYGDDLLTALRLHLDDLAEERPEEELATIRNALGPSPRRTRTGKKTARDGDVIASTLDGLGIVAPRESYRPLSVTDRQLARLVWEEEPPTDLIAEAQRACEEGFPATALKLGRDLWTVPSAAHYEAASVLLDGAYAGLGREGLRNILADHRNHREREWLDILEQEARENEANREA